MKKFETAFDLILALYQMEAVPMAVRINELWNSDNELDNFKGRAIIYLMSRISEVLEIPAVPSCKIRRSLSKIYMYI